MARISVSSMKNVYEHLEDETTKKIFESRVMYALTSDYRYVRQMFFDIPEKEKLDKLIDLCEKIEDKVVYYGAGNDLRIIRSLYPELKIECICDGDLLKQKNGWNGIKVISPEQLLCMDGAKVIISTTGFHREIKKFLLDGGIQKEKIIDLGEVMESLYNRQYFESSIMIPCEEGIFIDGGCYDCSTSILFANWCRGKYEKIYGFEPDKSNYLQCLKRGSQINNIEIFNYGLWSCKTELTFVSNQGQGSKIMEEKVGEDSIFVTSIDDVVKDEKVSFIKLDVEGAELEALHGAKNTILKNRPKLAISIYHKPEDVFEIPEYVLELNPDYKLYIRHYQFSEYETILYAI